jgi:hypothetical protein
MFGHRPPRLRRPVPRLYDRIGHDYARERRADPRIAARVMAAGAEALPLDGSVQVETVAISHDCRNGFVHAFWRRPQLLLDSSVRASMAVFARLDPTTVE